MWGAAWACRSRAEHRACRSGGSTRAIAQGVYTDAKHLTKEPAIIKASAGKTVPLVINPKGCGTLAVRKAGTGRRQAPGGRRRLNGISLALRDRQRAVADL